MDYNELLTSAKDDASLRSTINIDELLAATPHMSEQTLETISDDILDAVRSIPSVSPPIVQLICEKLAGYKYIDELHQLQLGRHIRWIRMSARAALLTPGGIVVDIQFTDTGANIVCKPVYGGFTKFPFSDALVFQKLSKDEDMVLFAKKWFSSGL